MENSNDISNPTNDEDFSKLIQDYDLKSINNETPVKGKIIDIKIEYPDDFTKQMLFYAEHYSFLPVYN